ncbi:MAG: hypothetical protein AAF085_05495 [Planctomycetota bacterium]
MDTNQERQDREIALSCVTWRLFRILSEFVDGFDPETFDKLVEQAKAALEAKQAA